MKLLILSRNSTGSLVCHKAKVVRVLIAEVMWFRVCVKRLIWSDKGFSLTHSTGCYHDYYNAVCMVSWPSRFHPACLNIDPETLDLQTEAQKTCPNSKENLIMVHILSCRVKLVLESKPTEAHARTWGPTNLHTKIFQLKRHRLKIDEKIIDSLSNLHLPIQCLFPYLLCKFHILPPKVHMGNPNLFLPRRQMPPGLLCFGHVDRIAIC